MLDQQTMSILHSLNLFGMARSFEERLADPKQAELTHAEFVGLLVQDGRNTRECVLLGGVSERSSGVRWGNES